MTKNKLDYRTVQLTKAIEIYYMKVVDVDGLPTLCPATYKANVGAIGVIYPAADCYHIKFSDCEDLIPVEPDAFELVYHDFHRPIFADGNRYTQVNFETASVHRGFKSIKAVFDVIYPLGGFIAGGYAAYMAVPESYERNGHLVNISPTQPKDVDIFCTTKDAFEAIDVALRNTLKFTQAAGNGIVNTYAPPYSLELLSCPTVQLIAPRQLANGTTVGTPEQVIDSFDFTVCRAALVDEATTIIDVDLIADYARKQLVFKTIHCPVGNSVRLAKYAAKGYHATAYQSYLLMEASTVYDADTLERLGMILNEMNKSFVNNAWADENIEWMVAEDLADEAYALMYID